jgi:hypothetical protein
MKENIMKRKQFLRYVGATLGGVALVPAIVACGGGDDLSAETESSEPETMTAALSKKTSPAPKLTVEEIAGLKYMREEEKLAHDVYVALFAMWGTNVFYQISLSESTHMQAILNLLTKYGIADPAAGKAPGVFEDQVLQALYNTLMASGQVSVIEAMKVGALIEETDIRDINGKKAATNKTDIIQVYDSLLCGSRNHLRSFDKQLVMRGVSYVPQVITQAEWDAIADSSNESCGGGGKQGRGR